VEQEAVDHEMMEKPLIVGDSIGCPQRAFFCGNLGLRSSSIHPTSRQVKANIKIFKQKMQQSDDQYVPVHAGDDITSPSSVAQGDAGYAGYAVDAEPQDQEQEPDIVKVIGAVYDVKSVEEFDAFVAGDVTVLADFGATWCGPCRAMAPFFADQAAQWPHVDFLRVDIDELPALATEFGVTSVPCFVFLRNNTMLGKVMGADRNAVLQALQALAPPPTLDYPASQP